jgi:2-polyprenyl-6-methoxyphenol hydroxylase-like FAD-dependent oxidoreductase
MHRADLHRILLGHVSAQLYTNHELDTFHYQEDGRIRLTFTTGEVRIVDALVGADGIHSKVRKGILGDSQPVFRGYNIWRGVCDASVDIGYGSETYGKGKRVGIVPIRDGKFGWWATVNEDLLESDGTEGAKKKLLRHFGDWHAPIPELIANTENIIKNSISDRIPTRGWSQGKAVLLGDAAHATTPNLGQGGCMAIEGAYVQGQCIKKYGLTEEAFQRYEALHFPRSKDIVETSLKMGKIGQWENSAAIFLRDTMMRMMPDKASMKLIDKYFAYDVTVIEV